jgi:hypothetical protein
MGNQIMPRPQIRIHDLETGQIVDRDMTDAELAQYEATIANAKISE